MLCFGTADGTVIMGTLASLCLSYDSHEILHCLYDVTLCAPHAYVAALMRRWLHNTASCWRTSSRVVDCLDTKVRSLRVSLLSLSFSLSCSLPFSLHFSLFISLSVFLSLSLPLARSHANVLSRCRGGQVHACTAARCTAAARDWRRGLCCVRLERGRGSTQTPPRVAGCPRACCLSVSLCPSLVLLFLPLYFSISISLVFCFCFSLYVQYMLIVCMCRFCGSRSPTSI